VLTSVVLLLLASSLVAVVF
jgi:hypothetical protein